MVTRGRIPTAGGLAMAVALPMPIETPAELVGHCREPMALTIPEVVLRQRAGLARRGGDPPGAPARIWDAMRRCA